MRRVFCFCQNRFGVCRILRQNGGVQSPRNTDRSCCIWQCNNSLFYQLLLRGIHDGAEFVGHQGGTADQAAVHIGLGKQLCGVVLVH